MIVTSLHNICLWGVYNFLDNNNLIITVFIYLLNASAELPGKWHDKNTVMRKMLPDFLSRMYKKKAIK